MGVVVLAERSTDSPLTTLLNAIDATPAPDDLTCRNCFLSRLANLTRHVRVLTGSSVLPRIAAGKFERLWSVFCVFTLIFPP